jgi:hypothetical protein
MISHALDKEFVILVDVQNIGRRLLPDVMPTHEIFPSIKQMFSVQNTDATLSRLIPMLPARVARTDPDRIMWIMINQKSFREEDNDEIIRIRSDGSGNIWYIDCACLFTDADGKSVDCHTYKPIPHNPVDDQIFMNLEKFFTFLEKSISRNITKERARTIEMALKLKEQLKASILSHERGVAANSEYDIDVLKELWSARSAVDIFMRKRKKQGEITFPTVIPLSGDNHTDFKSRAKR